MKLKYFLTYATEDGRSDLVFDSSDELNEWLSEHEFEEIDWVGPDHDWDYAPYGAPTAMMLVKGELVTPKPKSVVKAWDL